MFRKKKEKFNLYLDEIDYIDNEDDLLDEELLDDDFLEEEVEADLMSDSDQLLMDDMVDELDMEPVMGTEPEFQKDNDTDVLSDIEPDTDVLSDIESDTDVLSDQSETDILSDTWNDSESGMDDEFEQIMSEDTPDSGKKGLFGKKKSKSKKEKTKKAKGKKGRKNKKTGRKKILKESLKFSMPFGKKKDKDPASPSDGDDKPKKLTKKMIAAIAAAAVLVIGLAVFFIVRNLGGGDDTKAYVESVAELTGLGSANGMSNRYTGEVEAQDSWKITLQSDLSVAECFVSVGDEVKKGDKLFSYNTEEMKLNKEKKELEVETLTNEMSQLKKDITGYQNDLKSASASEKIELQTQILTAQTTIKKDEFTIKSSKEEIKTLEKNIKDATVKSKMDGLVKSINSSLGNSSGGESDDAASSYDDGSGDNAYMTILALGDYRVRGKISETNVWMLSEGDPVIIRSRVEEDKTWRGTIEKIKTDSNANTESSGSSDTDFDSGETTKDSASSYNFLVKLDSDDGLMMGQHVLIEVDNGQEDEREGMWLNVAYLHKDGDNYYVWAANKRDRLELRKVTVGQHNEELDDYEITDGLSISDYIAADSDSLHENMRITKVNSEADSTEYYDEEQNDDQIYDEGFDQGEFDEGDEGLIDDSGSVGGGQDLIDESDSGLGSDTLDDSGDNGGTDDGLVTID